MKNRYGPAWSLIIAKASVNISATTRDSRSRVRRSTPLGSKASSANKSASLPYERAIRVNSQFMSAKGHGCLGSQLVTWRETARSRSLAASTAPGPWATASRAEFKTAASASRTCPTSVLHRSNEVALSGLTEPVNVLGSLRPNLHKSTLEPRHGNRDSGGLRAGQLLYREFDAINALRSAVHTLRDVNATMWWSDRWRGVSLGNESRCATERSRASLVVARGPVPPG